MNVFEHNLSLLQKDLEQKKSIILFLGAGINGKEMSWPALMNDLFIKAIRIGFPEGQTSENEWKKIDSLSSTIKASIIKNVFKDAYIPLIQNFLYSKITSEKLKAALVKCQRIENNDDQQEDDDTKQFHTLFCLAKIIIACPYIKAVVTYNYDNFLSQSIKYIVENKDFFFTRQQQERIERFKKNKHFIRDVSFLEESEGPTKEEILIYHVHGYIPHPSEVKPKNGSQIILSLDEVNESTRDVYSWQNSTQLHFLNNYVSVWAGISFEGQNEQRMLYYTSKYGNNERIYYLNVEKDGFNKYHEIMCSFLETSGFTLLYPMLSFNELYDKVAKLFVNQK